MNVDLTTVISFLAPTMTLALTMGIRVFWDRISKKLDYNKDEMLTAIGTISKQMNRISEIQQHDGQRIAWLEGQSGQPLGTIKAIDRKEG